MTDKRSHTRDNAGRCESCDAPDTLYQRQSTYPVYLGGGLGWGTMWLCDKCQAEALARDGGVRPVPGVTEPR